MKFENRTNIIQSIQKTLQLQTTGIDDETTWKNILFFVLSDKSREDLIKYVQQLIHVKDDGVDGPVTWSKIQSVINKTESSQSNNNTLSPKSFKLILDYEVGGGENYYNKYLKKPSWPQGASGVTIGIGYDLGYNSSSQFEEDWGDKISTEDLNKLRKTIGYKGVGAKNKLSNVKNIQIPWESALQVFQQRTIPKFIKTTLNTFPEADKLHPDAFGALVSLVFNRGGSLKGSSRIEMARIRDLVPQKKYKEIANEIRSMKRLWRGKGLDGLLRRRDEEADLVESCA